ncbi:MAG: Serine/threonine protein kinase [Myxococcaceae bacterium]|nr:Serine/threonine protein kinase [Myxococcaceae bacterium]
MIGNYELLGLLGKGGMAEVYRARALIGPRQGQEFALKKLLPEQENDPGAVAMFAGEGDLARFLDHPHIVKVHEVGTSGESYFLVMDLVDGRDVGQIIKRCRTQGVQWPIDFAVYLTKVLLDALAYAHGAVGPSGKPLGIVHCDVSPSNFFVSRTGDLKLGDFGVARALIDGGAAEVMGKPYYLSPEIFKGQIDAAVDLWACTVTLYELLTLRRPFVGKTPDEVFAAIKTQTYVPVRTIRPEVPEVLEQVISKGFAAEGHNRYLSAQEFAAALEGHYDERVGTPLAISAVVRGLFGTTD